MAKRLEKKQSRSKKKTPVRKEPTPLHNSDNVTIVWRSNTATSYSEAVERGLPGYMSGTHYITRGKIRFESDTPRSYSEAVRRGELGYLGEEEA